MAMSSLREAMPTAKASLPDATSLLPRRSTPTHLNFWIHCGNFSFSHFLKFIPHNLDKITTL
ncbi:hypothetical protein [Nostoc sp.]|uniref:hypothetical protein n=1 Tax=Nostoc sp. TaxID=1180 RepID=UPI002FF520ED